MLVRLARMMSLAVVLTASGITSGIHPATAEVLATARDCDGHPCPIHDPIIVVPAGWVHDAEAELALRFQALVPIGKKFVATDVVIQASANPAPGNMSIADHIARDQQNMRVPGPNLRITELPDVARSNGGPAFRMIQYDFPVSRRAEIVATTIDTDSKGERYFVDIWLHADPAEALEGARASFLAILRGY
jgi:hypothetical protein